MLFSRLFYLKNRCTNLRLTQAIIDAVTKDVFVLITGKKFPTAAHGLASKIKSGSTAKPLDTISSSSAGFHLTLSA
jgi:hypothetical protein